MEKGPAVAARVGPAGPGVARVGHLARMDQTALGVADRRAQVRLPTAARPGPIARPRRVVVQITLVRLAHSRLVPKPGRGPGSGPLPSGRQLALPGSPPGQAGSKVLQVVQVVLRVDV